MCDRTIRLNLLSGMPVIESEKLLEDRALWIASQGENGAVRESAAARGTHSPPGS
jgi:hypothetical protein